MLHSEVTGRGLAVELAQLQQVLILLLDMLHSEVTWRGLAVEKAQLQQGVKTVNHYAPNRLLMKGVGLSFSLCFFPPVGFTLFKVYEI